MRVVAVARAMRSDLCCVVVLRTFVLLCCDAYL